MLDARAKSNRGPMRLTRLTGRASLDVLDDNRPWGPTDRPTLQGPLNQDRLSSAATVPTTARLVPCSHENPSTIVRRECSVSRAKR